MTQSSPVSASAHFEALMEIRRIANEPGDRRALVDRIYGIATEACRVHSDWFAQTPAEPERLPTHGSLLADINQAAHAAGTNAWVRDVLKRAHRAIRLNAPLAVADTSTVGNSK